jgi:hypothetical protein
MVVRPRARLHRNMAGSAIILLRSFTGFDPDAVDDVRD